MTQGTPNKSGPVCCRLNRRRFLLYGTVTAVNCLLPAPIRAAVERVSKTEKYLSFYSIHTRERLGICYYSQGQYQTDALTQINHILRDHRTNEIKPIDTRVLDILHDISSGFRSRSPFHVISGYRSPATNARLRRICKKVAPNSLHMKGKAIDIRLPGFPTQKLRKFAINLRKGGVGYYKRTDFVHLDVGKVRHWQG
jgi:uncharacterized protein YcbK (DUF882 family)